MWFKNGAILPHTACVYKNLQNNKKWSKKFDIRPHRCHTWMVQSCSPGGANVYPIHRKPKMVAMATSLSCRILAISAFCWPTTQTTLPITNSLVHIIHTKPVIAKCLPYNCCIYCTFATNMCISHSEMTNLLTGMGLRFPF